MTIVAIDHVQLAMPVGAERMARAFYQDLLGIPETPKPAPLAQRGGVWFERDGVKVHLGVEADFRPARKAHPAFVVAGFDALVAALREHRIEIVAGEPFEGHRRVHLADPFGNRIELIERDAQTG